MKTKTKEKVLRLARSAVKTIKTCLQFGLVRPETPDEKPTPERIRHSSRLNFGRDAEFRNVFKTRDQFELFDAYVYQRLRRDGVLKKMRGLTV